MTEKKCSTCGYFFETENSYQKMCDSCREQKRLERNKTERERLREKRAEETNSQQKDDIEQPQWDLSLGQKAILVRLYGYLSKVESDRKELNRQMNKSLHHFLGKGHMEPIYGCPICEGVLEDLALIESEETKLPLTEQIFKTNIEFEKWIGTLKKEYVEGCENYRAKVERKAYDDYAQQIAKNEEESKELHERVLAHRKAKEKEK